MKWKQIIALLLILLIALTTMACEKQPTYDTSPEFNPETDHQYFHMDANLTELAETETGYYYLTGHGSGFLRYIEKETMQDIALCNKPNCIIHEGGKYSDEELETCNAFFRTSWGHIFYYEGYLYCLENDTTYDTEFSETYTLTRISLDGTERKPIWVVDVDEADTEEVIEFSSIHMYILHRGVFYILINQTLYAYSLETEKVTKLRTFIDAEDFQRITAVGDYVFLSCYDEERNFYMFRYTVSKKEWNEYPETWFYKNGVWWTEDLEEESFNLNIATIEREIKRTIPLSSLVVTAVSEEYLITTEPSRRVWNGKEITWEEFYELPQEDQYKAGWTTREKFQIYDIETLELLGTVPYLDIGFPLFAEDRILFFVSESGKESMKYIEISDLGEGKALQWQTVERVN